MVSLRKAISVGFGLVSCSLCGISSAAPGDTELVSVSSTGGAAAKDVSSVATSGDGRYVAFSTDAANIVAGDTNGVADIFVRDRQSDSTERVSINSSGGQGNGASTGVAISADGRYIAFQSAATNLVSGDTNADPDIFVRDRESGITERVSVDSNGSQANFASESGFAISANGRYVAFGSSATNLVPNDTNNATDIFVHDRQTGATERVSVATNGAQESFFSFEPDINADGRYVVFTGAPLNEQVYLHDRQTGVTELINKPTLFGDFRSSSAPSISAGGRYVTYTSDAPNQVPHDLDFSHDVFVRDRQTGRIEKVSVDSSGGGSASNSGRNGSSISADGRFVAFDTGAPNLVPGDSTSGNVDVFVHDRKTGITQRVSVDSNGGTNRLSQSDRASISADGQYVAFASTGNLATADQNSNIDAYLHQLGDALPPGPFAVTPSTVDFGPQGLAVRSLLRSVHVTNTSSSKLPIVSIKLAGPNPAQFVIANSHCPSLLSVGASCAVDLAFRPGTVGPKTAKVVVDTGATAGAKSARLLGEGAITAFSLIPYNYNGGQPTVSLGGQAVGTESSHPKPVRIVNIGTAPFRVEDISLGGANPDQFTLYLHCNDWLGPECAFNVGFKPTSVGPKSATVTVKVTGGAAPKTVDVNGTGT